ncbi:hypothetical protein MBLNU13_g03749t1 [Cladosporium sp. NU13]
MHMQVVHNAYTPTETTELCSRAGTMKANMRIDKVFAIAPWYQENAPGVITLLGALIFPWGLTAILSTGADLCTGSFMLTTIACLHRRIPPWKMLLHWFVTFWGNLAGSLFVMAIITGYGGTFSSTAQHARVVTFATAKAITPAWHQVFLRGIGANWLVCLAAYLSFMGREFFSKVVGIWWPTFAFVMLGFDHVVANMFYIPLGIFVGTPGLSVGHYIAYSMIPALLGNIVGGGLFVGAVYWYLYLAEGNEPNMIDDELFAADKRPLLPIQGERTDGTRFEEGSGSGARTPRSLHRKESKDPENMV